MSSSNIWSILHGRFYICGRHTKAYIQKSQHSTNHPTVKTRKRSVRDFSQLLRVSLNTKGGGGLEDLGGRHRDRKDKQEKEEEPQMNEQKHFS